jgi:acyl-CoA synthetase (AMP-forming)/AMP-acid ligase II
MPTDPIEESAAKSFVELFRSRVDAHPDLEALVMVTDPDRPDQTRTLTYRQLDAEAVSVAAQLRGTCRPQDRVLLLYPSGPEFVAAFLGCLYAGVIAVPAPFPGRRENRQERQRLTGIVENAGVSLVLTRGHDRAAVDAWRTEEALDSLRCETTDEHADERPGSPTAHSPEVFDAEPDTIAFLQYTSGSTGEPKGVVLRHRNVTSNIEILARMLQLHEPRPRVCSWLPLHHDMGLIGTVLFPLMKDGTSILLDPTTFLRQPYLWLRTMARYQASVSAAPSFAYALCTERVTDAQLDLLDLSSVERLGNGAEKIDPTVMNDFLQRFAPAGLRTNVFGPSYGLAEATLAVAVKAGYEPAAPASGPDLGADAFDDRGRSAVSCGAVPYFDLRIVDPVTAEVRADGQEGEIWLRGPSVSSGYWEREEETRETFGGFIASGDGPFLRTGDLGVLHDGELYVSGRIKDVIVVHGKKIFPQDIEQELRAQHPELGDIGAVFALPSPVEQGPAPVAIVHEIGADSVDRFPVLANEVKHTAAKEFGVFVESVVFVEIGSIPRTSSGKVQRAEARDLYLAGTLKTIPNRNS